MHVIVLGCGNNLMNNNDKNLGCGKSGNCHNLGGATVAISESVWFGDDLPSPQARSPTHNTSSDDDNNLCGYGDRIKRELFNLVPSDSHRVPNLSFLVWV